MKWWQYITMVILINLDFLKQRWISTPEKQKPILIKKCIRENTIKCLKTEDLTTVPYWNYQLSGFISAVFHENNNIINITRKHYSKLR